MTQDAPKIRLHLDASLHEGAEIALEREASHYLFTVMRLEAGAAIAVFNSEDGEWRAEAVDPHRKAGRLRVRDRMRAPESMSPLELIFAPIKKARTDFIVEKASELGVGAVRPVFTRFTNAERLRPDRLRAHMIEAAEQCGGIRVPELRDAVKLDTLLAAWPAERPLIFCDEARDAPPLRAALGGLPRGTKASVLIGPEGGFAPEERRRLLGMEAARAVSLGPRILRADTAAVAALALVQDAIGDWG